MLLKCCSVDKERLPQEKLKEPGRKRPKMPHSSLTTAGLRPRARASLLKLSSAQMTLLRERGANSRQRSMQRSHAASLSLRPLRNPDALPASGCMTTCKSSPSACFGAVARQCSAPAAAVPLHARWLQLELEGELQQRCGQSARTVAGHTRRHQAYAALGPQASGGGCGGNTFSCAVRPWSDRCNNICVAQGHGRRQC